VLCHHFRYAKADGIFVMAATLLPPHHLNATMEASKTTAPTAPDTKIRLALLRGRITLSEALSKDRDALHELAYTKGRLDFLWDLLEHQPEILETVSRHLGIPATDLELPGVLDWKSGSFNYCLPIKIARCHHPALPERVIIRFALPYSVGAISFPDGVDEKVRCEAATYIWLQENCPDVPIPRLYGFAFPGTQSVGKALLVASRASNSMRLLTHVYNSSRRSSLRRHGTR